MPITLSAKQINGKWDVQLHGLPSRAVVELRVQDTMNGKERILGMEADSDGTAIVPIDDFGQHMSAIARILTENNVELLHPLHFTTSEATAFVMTSVEQTVPETPKAVTVGALHSGDGEEI